MIFNQEILPPELEKCMLGVELLDDLALESLPQPEGDRVFLWRNSPQGAKEGG